MPGFRVARGLLTLFADIDAVAPGRSKISDGTIGDAAHQKRRSDHNPDKNRVVRAIDVTHDPTHNADMAVIAEQIRVRRDRRTKYIIFNRRIASANTGWVWAKFTGNPHTHHMHISVVADDRADDPSTWGLRQHKPPINPNNEPADDNDGHQIALIVDAPPFEPFDLHRTADDPHRVRWLQAILGQHGWGHLPISGSFDEATETAVKAMQRDLGVDDDGRYGRRTALALSTFLNNPE